jgi:hypothetical protein
MKSIPPLILVSSLIVFLFFSGCKKAESTTGPTGPGTATGGTASFTLNGAGFSNQTVNIALLVGGFSVSNNMTGVAGSSVGAADTTWLTMAFPGSSTGTFQFSDTVGVVIRRGGGSSARMFVNGLGGGQIAVTAYGSVGGNITGSFSGRLYDVTLSGIDSVSVSNGSFSALRAPND